MAYEKQNFVDRVKDVTGQIVTEGTTLKAEHLNHIEDGIEALDIQMGDVSTALDEIIASQEALIGGSAE